MGKKSKKKPRFEKKERVPVETPQTPGEVPPTFKVILGRRFQALDMLVQSRIISSLRDWATSIGEKEGVAIRVAEKKH